MSRRLLAMPLPFILKTKATKWFEWARECNHLWRNRERRAIYKKLILAGEPVFDFGANAGHYSRICCNRGARVVAIAPQRPGQTVSVSGLLPRLIKSVCGSNAPLGEQRRKQPDCTRHRPWMRLPRSGMTSPKSVDFPVNTSSTRRNRCPYRPSIL